MKAKITAVLSVFLLLALLILLRSGGRYAFAEGASGGEMNELYSRCAALYSEYTAALKSGAGRDAVEASFQRYRAALDKYKEMLNKKSPAETLQDSSALPAAGENPMTGPAVQDAVNAGGRTVSQSVASPSSRPVSDGVVMASVLNVRSGPWGDVIGQIKSGAKVEILSRQGSWYKVSYGGREAYIHAGYVATKDSVAEAYEGFVTSAGLNVRSAPGGSVLGELAKGAAVEVLEKRGEWLVIKYNGREAFVDSAHISSKSDSGSVSGAAVSRASAEVQPSPAVSSRSSLSAGSTVTTYMPAASNISFGACGDMIGGPVPPARVTSTFGPRELFGKNFHYGVDLGVPTGTPLRSLGDGKVISTGYDYGGGKTITIKYANGMTSSYAHCRDASVAVGATVKRGDVVGHTNNTGAYTTGPHLHFSLKDAAGKFVDPLKVPSVWY